MAAMEKILKTVPFAAVCIMGAMCIGAHAEADIAIGEYIQMGSYAGKPIVWRCVAEDGNGSLMLSDKIICDKPFDAAGTAEGGSHARGVSGGRWSEIRMEYGSNYWGDSNIRCWLNSASAAGGVEWKCQNPPVAENIRANGKGVTHAYSDEAGFLSNFTPEELGAVKTVTQKSILYENEYDPENKAENPHRFNSYTPLIVQNYDTAYGEDVTDRMFLLDIKQVKAVYDNLGDYYLPDRTTLDGGFGYEYWLRTPMSLIPYSTRTVCRDGSEEWAPEATTKVYIYGGHVECNDTFAATVGVRPAFYLDRDNAVFVSGSGSAEDPYIVSSQEASPLVSDWALPVISEYDDRYGISELGIGDYRQSITREDFCELAYHTLVSEGAELTAPGYAVFADTDNEKVAALSAAGIIKGRSETEFMPGDNITREEAAVILCRLAGYIGRDIPAAEDTAAYEDEAEISPWAVNEVMAMKAMGIMTGVTAGEFMPRGTYTAEQAVTTMLRVF